jgi:hypothetical protein
MFVSDRIVYLQMQKTASTHIAKTLQAIVGGEQHLQHMRLAIEPGDRLVMASIRSPWAWYVSLWAYGCREGGGAHGLYHRVTADPPTMRELVRRSAHDLRVHRRLPRDVVTEVRTLQKRQRGTRTDLWRPVYSDPDDVHAFRSWLRLMYDPARAHELPGQPPRYGDTGLPGHAGYMTFRYFTLLADERAGMGRPGALATLEAVEFFDREHTVHDDMIRIEHLHEELLRVLERAGYDLDDRQRAELARRCTTKTNASPHRSVRDYYDPETLDLVAERESFLIEKYGYSVPE